MTPAAGAVLASFPSPDQGVWHLGPIPIRAYALCIIAGIVLAIFWSERRWAARGGERGVVTDIAVFAVPFGLIGGRLYHVITDYWRYFGPGKDPLNALKIWDGGLGIWGAVVLGGVGAWIACRRRGVPLPAMADAIAPGLIAAQAIGRVGNYFNQELYGGATNLPWGLEIFRRVDPSTGLEDPLGGIAVNHTPVAIVQPTFLYELLWNLAVAGLVVFVDRKFRLGHGRAFAVYVAGYTFGRFWIEIMRDDPATHVFGVRVNVWVAALVFAGALLYLALVRGKREDPATLRGPGTESGNDPGSAAAAPAESSATRTFAASDATIEPSAESTEASRAESGATGAGATEYLPKADQDATPGASAAESSGERAERRS